MIVRSLLRRKGRWNFNIANDSHLHYRYSGNDGRDRRFRKLSSPGDTMMKDTPDDRPDGSARAPRAGVAGADRETAPERVPSSRLFGLRDEVLIDHDGALYRLRRTSKGRLILTK